MLRTLALGYILWITYVMSIVGEFPYAFLNLFNETQLIIFFSAALTITGIVSVIFRQLLLLRWGHHHLIELNDNQKTTTHKKFAKKN